jgi:CHRD domain
MLRAFAAVVVAALGLSGLALAASHVEKYTLTANLTAGQEVPKPVGTKAGATGKFTATLVESGKSKKLTWKLTYANLTGKALAAHIHLGKKGKAGAVAVALCGPCKSGQKGSTQVTEATVKAVEAGKTYVNVHTTKNQAGEIRGQVKISE